MAVFKKILASTLALAAIAAAGTTAAADSVDTPSACKPWSVNYTYGAPSYISSQMARCKLYTYGGGYQTITTSFDGGGDGYVSVRVGDTQYWMITGRGTVPYNGCQIPINGNTITFDLWAVGNRVTAGGYIHNISHKH